MSEQKMIPVSSIYAWLGRYQSVIFAPDAINDLLNILNNAAATQKELGNVHESKPDTSAPAAAPPHDTEIEQRWPSAVIPATESDNVQDARDRQTRGEGIPGDADVAHWTPPVPAPSELPTKDEQIEYWFQRCKRIESELANCQKYSPERRKIQRRIEENRLLKVLYARRNRGAVDRRQTAPISIGGGSSLSAQPTIVTTTAAPEEILRVSSDEETIAYRGSTYFKSPAAVPAPSKLPLTQKTLLKQQTWARQDDWDKYFVGSDIRVLIGQALASIELEQRVAELERGNAELKARMK